MRLDRRSVGTRPNRQSDSSSKGRELSAPPSFVPRRPQRFSKTVVSHSLVDPDVTTTRRAARGLSSRGRVLRSTHLLNALRRVIHDS